MRKMKLRVFIVTVLLLLCSGCVAYYPSYYNTYPYNYSYYYPYYYHYGYPYYYYPYAPLVYPNIFLNFRFRGHY